MKMSDKHRKVDIEMTYRQAELVWAALDTLMDLENDSSLYGLKKDQKDLLNKMAKLLDEYINT